MARIQWQTKSIGFARQTAYSTENTTDGDFTYMPVEITMPDMVRATEQFAAATGQLGAREAPVIGSKHGGKATLKFPLYVFKSSYAPVTDAPGAAGIISPHAVLLGWALGSGGAAASTSAAEFAQGYVFSRSAYAANQVKAAPGPTTSSFEVVTPGGITIGQLAVFDDGAAPGTDPTIGWVKNITTDTVDLFEAAAFAPSANDERYGTATAYPSRAARDPLTIRILGESSAVKWALIGCLATEVRIIAPAGKTPMVEIDIVWTDDKRYSTGGGMKVYASFVRCKPALGAHNARLTYGNTGSGVSTCGIKDMQITVSWPTEAIECMAHQQGVSEVVYGDPEIKVSLKIPADDADSITSNADPYETDFNNGTSKSIGIYIGNTLGQIVSILLPALHHASRPKLEGDNILYHALELEPHPYVGDGSTSALGTAPADTLLRVGLA